MTWSKLAGFFSLKAIVLACFLTPVTVPATGIMSAQAQINIFIPGLQIPGYGGRRYGRSRAYQRSARRGGRRGGQQQEVSGTSSGPTPVTSSGANSSSSVPLSSPTPVTSSRGYRPSTD